MMKNKKQAFPKVALGMLLLIVFCSIFAGMITPYAPQTMNPDMINVPPGGNHIFGTDSLGRDLFTLIVFGGRASLFIGFFSSLISTTIAVIYGSISGICGEKIDNLLMRFTELMMSIPSILLIIFLQAIWGEATYVSLAVVIGSTGWMNIAKVVRNEVRQIGKSDYILAARTMEASFWYVLRVHLLPNLIPAIMFMVVTNIGQAIIVESTLSFLGLGLPLAEVSWGSLLSMSQGALLTNCWWIIVIPGMILITTLVCVTEIGEYVRKKTNRIYSNL